MYKTRPSKRPETQEFLTLFLRNIPEESRINEISQFVAPALKGGLFSKPGKILKIDILALRDVYSSATEFHAVVNVDNAAAGRRAIKKLHAQRFKNKRIEVKEYIKRDWQNDWRSKKLLSYHEISDGLMQSAAHIQH